MLSVNMPLHCAMQGAHNIDSLLIFVVTQWPILTTDTLFVVIHLLLHIMRMRQRLHRLQIMTMVGVVMARVMVVMRMVTAVIMSM